MAVNLNTELRDELLRNAHLLRRVENGALAKMVIPFSRAKVEMTQRLAELQTRLIISPNLPLADQVAILNQQLASVDGILTAAALEASGELESVLYDVAQYQNRWTFGLLARKFAPIGVVLNELPFTAVDFMASNPLLGEAISTKLLWSNRNAVNAIRSEIEQSLIQGEGISAATKRLLGVGRGMGGTIGRQIKDRAEMIARSEILYVSNQVNRGIFRENKDVLTGVIFVATLDSRTCLSCAAVADTFYPFLSDEQDHLGPSVPLHPHCRCVYSPVTKSWTDLGADPATQTGKDYFSGKEPSFVTYDEWLNTQSTSVQKDILGPARYKMWSQGDIKLSQMATDRKILTIKDLEKKL